MVFFCFDFVTKPNSPFRKCNATLPYYVYAQCATYLNNCFPQRMAIFFKVKDPTLFTGSWYLWMAQKSWDELPARLRVTALALTSKPLLMLVVLAQLLFSLKVNSFFLI